MIRKKIGSKSCEIDTEDNIDIVDVIDEDLQEISVVGEPDFSDESGDIRRNELSKRAAEFRNKHSDLNDFVSEEVATHNIECTCDVCMKSFFRKSDSKSWDCPYCGHKYELEDLEEINTLQENPYKDIQVSDTRAQERRQRFQNLFQHRSDTWEDGRKEQISLELGSDEYEEYLDDLQSNNPENSNDSFHDRLEQHNEDLVTKNYDGLDNPESAKLEDSSLDDAAKMQRREEMQKRDIHAIAVRETIAAAALTETLSDDQLARAITTDNEVLYDRNVKPDEYINALKEYVVGPGY